MNTSVGDREDIYEATRDLACRLSYLVEHLAQKALRGKNLRTHLEVLVHSREALEAAPLFLTLPDEMIDQIDVIVEQADVLREYIETQASGTVSQEQALQLQQILLDVPRDVVALPVEYQTTRARPAQTSTSGARAS